MAVRFSWIFQLTTDPEDSSAAIPHTAGWTESHWDSGTSAINVPAAYNIAQLRAAMLPQQAAILGWKRQEFTINENKLIGGGVQTLKALFPGSGSYNVNVPQDAMMFSAALASGPNAVRFTARALPDEVVAQGEFNGSQAFKNRMKAYTDALVAQAWCALARDLTQTTVRVISIVNKVITVDNLATFAAGQWVILKRVRDSNTGEPISGSFYITAVDSVNKKLTVDGLSATAVAGQGGFARRDLITVSRYSSIAFNRAVVRKVGAPFEKYRGRRSKRRG